MSELEQEVADQEEVAPEEVEQPEAEEGEAESEQPEETGEANDQVDQEIVQVSFGDNAPAKEEQKEESKPFIELRKAHRDLSKRAKELEEKVRQYEAPKKVELGTKPTLEACDYDTDKFETELTTWHDKKKAYDAEQAQAAKEKQEFQEEYNKKVESYKQRKVTLKAVDFEEAESLVKEYLDETRQGIMLEAVDVPALFVLALGRNEEKLKELSKIKSFVKFAGQVAKLETQMKITKGKATTPPEKPIKPGAGQTSRGQATTLEKLREEAAKTGDFTKVLAFKKSMKQK